MHILLTDDHPVFLDGLKKSVYNKDFEISTAISAKLAIDIINTQNVDCVISDYSFRDETTNGAMICKFAKAKNCNCKTMVITNWNSYDIIDEIVNATVDGLLLKDSNAKEIRTALDYILQGEKYYSLEISKIIARMQEPKNEAILSPTELEIAKLLQKGSSQKEIAGILCRSLRSIEAHLSNMRLKLNAKNTSVLLQKLIEKKLI